MKRKICVTIPSLHGAGCERMLSEVLPFYAEAFDVDLVMVENKINYAVPDTVNVISLDLPIYGGGLVQNALNAVKVVLRFRKKIKNDGYVAIISYLDLYNVLVCCANSSSRKKKKHIVVEQTTDYEFFANSQIAKWKQWVIKRSLKWAYNRVDRIIAVSHNLKDFLVRELGIKREITVIHNGVDINKFGLEPPADTVHLDERFMAASTRLLCISRLDRQKNIQFLIDSFAAATDKVPEAKLFILGTGPMRQVIEEKINLLNLNDRVFLLGFSKQPEDYLKLCDAFVIASRYESFGNVVVEALACGAPVLTTNYGAVVTEILQGDGLGMIIEQGDVTGFANALIDIVLQRDRYDREDLHRYAKTHFDIRAKGVEYVATVNSLLSDA